jgi:hypothetical protein
MLRDDELEQHTPWDPKNALLGVEFDVVLSKFLEGFFEVGHELVGLFGLDYDVVHVSLASLTDEFFEIHTSLVCSSYVFEPERHHDVTERSKWGDERGRELVGLFHRDLMVSGVASRK